MTVSTRPAEVADLIYILENPRNELKAEFAEGAHEQFRRMLEHGRETWAVEIDRDLVCIWGVLKASILENRAYVWLLGTPFIERHAKAFARESMAIVHRLLEAHYRIEVHVADGFDISVRWIEWLGGRQVGVDCFNGVNLRRFEILRRR